MTRRSAALGFRAARAVSGMAGIGLLLVLLYEFDRMTGQGFLGAALLPAAFFGGTAAGACVGLRAAGAAGGVALLMLFQTLLALPGPVTVVALRELPLPVIPRVVWALPVVAAFAGLAVGAQVALSRLSPSGRKPAALTPASAWGWESAGAGLGALAVGFCLPILGPVDVGWTLSALCLASLPVLFLAGDGEPLTG
jgi:hypothetical protein